MKVNFYKLLDEIVERGINDGYTNAMERPEKPSEQQLKNAIHLAITTHICDYFIFDGEFEE